MNYTKKDIKFGNFYKVSWDNMWAIFECTNELPDNKDAVEGTYINSYCDDVNNSEPWITGRLVINATYDEIEWLKESIRMGRKVEKKKIYSYELY